MVKKGFLVDPRVDLSEYEDDEPEEEEIDPDSEEGMAELKAQQGGNSIGFFSPKNGPKISPKTGPMCHLKRIHA